MADVIQNEEFFDRVGNRLFAVNLEATVFKGKGIHVVELNELEDTGL